MKIYKITPVAKPRMTRSDKWKKRPATDKYWKFKDQVREHGIEIPESGAHIVFVLPMPKSWSKTKRGHWDRMPHQQRPDKDNLEKALLDAVFDEDCRIWDSRVTKIWGVEGEIIIGEYWKGTEESQ